MRPEDVGSVRALPLFAGMADDSFAKLVKGAYVQWFPPQLKVIEQGARADFLHVLTDGLVALEASEGDRSTVIEILEPLATFVLAAVIREAPYLVSARTLERSRILMIPAENVQVVFAEDAAFARSMVVELARGFRGLMHRLQDQKLRGSVDRLADYLASLSRAAAGRSFDLPTDKRTLAAYLGMTPENLSRSFSALGERGVRVVGRTVTITRPDALERRHGMAPATERQDSA